MLVMVHVVCRVLYITMLQQKNPNFAQNLHLHSVKIFCFIEQVKGSCFLRRKKIASSKARY